MFNKFATIHWDEVKKKVEKEEWAKAIVESIKLGFDGFCREWKGTPPTEMSEWLHHYFCKDCAVNLVVDFGKPHEHQCPACGKVYSGELVDGAWRKMVHGSIVSNMERAAILANLFPGEDIYKRYLKENILFYTENYEKYEIHGKNVGKGRVMPQNLTEAIFIIEMERIIRMVGEIGLFTAVELERIGDSFFRPAANLIKPQIYMIHNIHSWMNAALAASAHFLKDKNLMDFAIHGEFGWINQVQKGVTEEGLWYEISPGYHYYTMKALLSLAWIALEEGINLFSVLKFEKMFRIPLQLAYETGELPAYNDTNYGGYITGAIGDYEQYASICPEAAIYLETIYSIKGKFPCQGLSRLPNACPNPDTAYSRASVSALIYGPNKLKQDKKAVGYKGSRLFGDTGIGILENKKIRVSLKFTKASGWHDHYDKLAIDIFALGQPISADFGSTGYGIDFNDKWNRSSVAHNMVIIDGKKQEACNAELINWDENKIQVQTDKAYPGTLLRRSLQLLDNGFSDYYEVESENNTVIDWVFHCKGEINMEHVAGRSQVFKKVSAFTDGNGYDMLTNLMMMETDEDWSLTWEIPEGALKLEFVGAEGTQVFSGRCYGNNALEQQGIVIVRRRLKKTAFDARFTVMTGE